MSILAKKTIPQAQKVWFTDAKMYVLLTDGRELGIPLEWFPKLRDATESERMNWRLIGGGIGIHWENIDEDLSVAGLL
jgi:hypothetical protein